MVKLREAFDMADVDGKNDGFPAKNDGFRTKNDGFPAKNDGFRTKDDGFRTKDDGFRSQFVLQMMSFALKSACFYQATIS